jgi:hypothetical protein
MEIMAATTRQLLFIRRRVKQSMRKHALARHACFAGIEAAAVHRAIAALGCDLEISTTDQRQ